MGTGTTNHGGVVGAMSPVPYWKVSPVSERPWTRLGIASIAGHLGYELAAGVAVPLAPHVGVRAGVAAFALPAAAAYAPAGRMASPRGDRTYAVANGFFLA